MEFLKNSNFTCNKNVLFKLHLSLSVKIMNRQNNTIKHGSTCIVFAYNCFAITHVFREFSIKFLCCIHCIINSIIMNARD